MPLAAPGCETVDLLEWNLKLLAVYSSYTLEELKLNQNPAVALSAHLHCLHCVSQSNLQFVFVFFGLTTT